MKTVIAAVPLSLLLLASCGGGGQSSTPPPSIPVFTSTAPSTASEGVAYSYSIAANDPSNSTITYQIVSAPPGASISGNTLTWTPTHGQSRVANNFSIKATTVSGGSATQNWTVTPHGTIRVTHVYTYVTDMGTTDVPVNSWVAAVVPDAQAGFVTIAGTISPDGTVSIANVPPGSYWLRGPGGTAKSFDSTSNYVWTNSSDPDIGFAILGRPETTPSIDPSLNLSLANLNPWQTSDALQIYSSNAGALFDSQSVDSQWGSCWGSVAPGVTAINNLFCPWTQRLVEGSMGDRAWVYQLTTQSLGVPVQTLTKFWQPDPFTMDPFATTNLSGTLADVPAAQMSSVRANIKGSVFEQLRINHPLAEHYSTRIYLSVQPTGSLYGQIGPTPDLVMYLNSIGPITIDTDLGDIPYGNPFPSTWTPFIYYQHELRVPRLAPGASVPVGMLSSISGVTLTMPTATQPLGPVVGTVTSPKINGVTFFNDQTGVGTSPTLSWSPPTVGTANGYRISVLRLNNNAGTSSISGVAFLRTTTTSITVPPGLLEPSNSYLFAVIAMYTGGVDISVTPYHQSFPAGSAGSISGVITP